MAEDKANTELAPILSLEQYRDQLHPHALERYLRFLGEVRDLLLSGQLTEGELKSYLSQEEQIELGIFEREIAEWLVKCRKDSGEASLSVYPYSMSPYYSMSQFQSLLRTAVERKVEKSRQEQEKKRRLAALEEIDPPLDDAEIYLTPEEQQEFLDSIPGAIDAYLGRDKRAESYSPGIWLLNSKASEYAYWTSIIKGRKEKEARQKRADLEYTQYLKEVNDAIKSLKSELAKAKKPKFSYPKWLAGYYPDLWFDLSLPTMEKIEGWAKPKIEQLVPQVLRKFLRYDLDWQVQALPEGKYKECGGVPCLSWSFFILVLISARLTLPGGNTAVEFEGYRYEIKLNAVDLGDLYLGPVMGGTVTGGTTPVALMSMLEKGELEGPGIKVVNRGAPFTTFHVQGFEETVVVHDSFRSFIRDISEEKSLAEALLAKWLVDKDTATLLQEKADLPLPQLVGVQASAGSSTVDNTDVVAALQALGYKKGEIEKALNATKFSPEASVEEKVKGVLKNIGA